MHAVGINRQDNLVEIMELEGHPWFIGVQFHPEYKSTVANPHPLFVSFIKAARDFMNTIVPSVTKKSPAKTKTATSKKK